MNTNVFPQTEGTEQKIKSYWNRPGGKFGTIIGLGILGVIGYFVIPILTTIVWNTVNFAIACAVAFALFMILTNRKLWLSLFYLYEILMKKLVGIVIELDPFIIAEDYIKDIEKERENLYNKSLEVDGQRQRVSILQQVLAGNRFILMDEPFSGLDVIMKDKVIELILKISNLNEYNTLIIVSHDIESSCAISDTVYVLSQSGEIQGSTITKTYDLLAEGLAYSPEIKENPRFQEIIKEIKSII